MKKVKQSSIDRHLYFRSQGQIQNVPWHWEWYILRRDAHISNEILAKRSDICLSDSVRSIVQNSTYRIIGFLEFSMNGKIKRNSWAWDYVYGCQKTQKQTIFTKFHSIYDKWFANCMNNNEKCPNLIFALLRFFACRVTHIKSYCQTSQKFHPNYVVDWFWKF